LSSVFTAIGTCALAASFMLNFPGSVCLLIELCMTHRQIRDAYKVVFQRIDLLNKKVIYEIDDN
jgi:hypothetical protein